MNFYIEGIEPGDFFNSLTREIYGPEAYFLPVHFQKLWAVWVERDSGGGFRGFHESPAAAKERAAEEDKPCEILDTHLQYGLVIHGDTAEQVTIPMSRSKMKASRQLNSLCRTAGGPRFSRIYKLSSFENEGPKGDYIDLTVELVRPLNEGDRELFEEAQKLYDIVKSGIATMHSADIEGVEEDDTEY